MHWGINQKLFVVIVTFMGMHLIVLFGSAQSAIACREYANRTKFVSVLRQMHIHLKSTRRQRWNILTVHLLFAQRTTVAKIGQTEHHASGDCINGGATIRLIFARDAPDKVKLDFTTRRNLKFINNASANDSRELRQ